MKKLLIIMAIASSASAQDAVIAVPTSVAALMPFRSVDQWNVSLGVDDAIRRAEMRRSMDDWYSSREADRRNNELIDAIERSGRGY